MKYLNQPSVKAANIEDGFIGRMVSDDKRGAISSSTPAILTRLNTPIEQWLIDNQRFEQVQHRRFRTTA